MAAASPGAFASGLAKHERMCYSGGEEDILPPGWGEPGTHRTYFCQDWAFGAVHFFFFLLAVTMCSALSSSYKPASH